MTCDYCGAKDDTHGWMRCLENVEAERGQVQIQLDAANLQIGAMDEALRMCIGYADSVLHSVNADQAREAWVPSLI